MSVLINAIQTLPLPFEGFGEYLTRTVASKEEFVAFGATMAEFDQLDSEGSFLLAFDKAAFEAVIVLKTAHEQTERTKSAPPQSLWSSIATATKVLLKKTQDGAWEKAYRDACATRH